MNRIVCLVFLLSVVSVLVSPYPVVEAPAPSQISLETLSQVDVNPATEIDDARPNSGLSIVLPAVYDEPIQNMVPIPEAPAEYGSDVISTLTISGPIYIT